MKRLTILCLAVVVTVIHATTAVAAVFAPNPNNSVLAILPLPDGGSVIGGQFGQVGGASRYAIARLEADGTVDAGFTPAVNGRVRALALHTGGRILIGGEFTEIDGAPREVLARLNADGSVDTSFASHVYEQADGAVPRVDGIIVQPDGKILVSSGFTSVDGQPRAGIARLNADGTLDEGFVPVFAGSDLHESGSPVASAALQADGKIVIGGYMSTGSGSVHVQRLHSDGSLDGSFSNEVVNGWVNKIVVQGDGRIILAGRFTLPYPKLVRLQSNGSLDTGFDAGMRLDMVEVYALKLQTDGKLVVAGSTAYASTGYPAPPVVRLTAGGSSDPDFVRTRIRYGNVLSAAVQDDGKILVGGFFYEVDDHPRANLARLSPDGSIEVPEYTVTPVAGPNGQLTPSTPQSIPEGGTASFDVRPAPGHVLGSISGCNGSLNGARYVTGPITADCSVTATFVASSQTFTISAQVLRGSISPTGPVTVPVNEVASFTLTPDPGFYFDVVSGCAGTLSGNIYTTGPVTADCTITTTFIAPAGAVLTGTPQTTGTELPFAQPLKVRVLSGYPVLTTPVKGVEVRFQTPASGAGATVSSESAVTDANGEVTVNATANGVGGGYVVKAVVAGLESTPYFFILNNEAADGPGIELAVTLTTDPPPACGASNELEVEPGTPVNYCFSITNRTASALTRHSLQHLPWSYFWTLDSDQALYLKEIVIPSQATVRHHVVLAAGAEDLDQRFRWTSFAGKPGYHVNASANEPFRDISATGTPVVSARYGVADLPMPFPLTFFGTIFGPEANDHLCIHNSGAIRLVPGLYVACPSTANQTLVPPFVGDNEAIEGNDTDGILPHWDLLGDNGRVYMQVFGDSPRRSLVVQWNRKDHASLPNPADGITFQAIIDESVGTIRYVYRDLDFNNPSGQPLNNGRSARIGLLGTNLGIDAIIDVQPPLQDGQAIVFTPTPKPHTAVAETRLHVGTPRIQAPLSMTAVAAPGASVARTLPIANIGNLPLAWSLDQAAPNAHFPQTPRRLVSQADSGIDREKERERSIAHTTFGAEARSFEVPAYGAMQAVTTNSLGGSNYVTFNLNDPARFIGMPFNAVGTQGGDFIGDDFTKHYILFSPDQGDSTYLYVLDYATSDVRAIGGQLHGVDERRLSGMAWDRTTSTLFASSSSNGPCDEQNPSVGSTLYAIDHQTGAMRVVAPIVFDDGIARCVSDIAVSPDGLMYGLDVMDDALVAIDKTSGRAAAIGSLGVNIRWTNSIDFDDTTGVLYLAAGYYPGYGTTVGGVYTIDTMTGLAQRIAAYPQLPNQPLNGYLQVDALAIARAGGACAHPGDIPWLTFDVWQGSTQPGQTSSVRVILDASGLAPGEYAANICISSNDRSRSLLAIPLTFTVDAAHEAIFRNGFESMP